MNNPPHPLVAEHLERWMKLYVEDNCQETTAYGYRNIVENHLVPYMGNIKLQDLNAVIIQEYYSYLSKGKKLSANSIRRHHALLHKALDFGLKQSLVHRNVMEGVTQPKGVKSVGKSYTKEQIKLLLQKVRGTKLEVPVYLAVGQGLRREEITGLRWEHVDLDQRVLQIIEVRTAAGVNNNIVKMPKTEKSRRSMHIVDEVYNLLVSHKAWQESRESVWENYTTIPIMSLSGMMGSLIGSTRYLNTSWIS